MWKATLKVANSAHGEKILYEVHPIENAEAGEKITSSSTGTNVHQKDPVVNKEMKSSRNRMSKETKAAIDAYRARQDALSKAQKALYDQERKEIVKAYKDKLKNLERSYSEEVADIQKAFFSLVRSYEAKADEAGASGEMVAELTEALRGQLYMDADAIKIALSKLREGKGRIVEGTSSRRGNPTITTEIPINGYTIYVEEPMSGLSATSLEGRTMYLMPTSTTALVQGNKPVNIPQRRSGLKPIIDASDRIVNGNLSGSDGKPMRLHTVDFQSPEFNANRANGVYCMSTDIDALNTTNQPVNTEEFFAAIKNPYIVTAANPIITDEDIRNGLVANRISEVKRGKHMEILTSYVNPVTLGI